MHRNLCWLSAPEPAVELTAITRPPRLYFMGLYITIGREKKVRRGREGRGKGKGSRMEGRVAPSNWKLGSGSGGGPGERRMARRGV